MSRHSQLGNKLVAMAFALAAVVGVGGQNIVNAQVTAYVDATIETADKAGRLEEGILVVDGDTIVDVGKDVEIPDDARVISLDGKTVMPGIIDPYFVYSTTGAATATRTVVFRGRTFVIPVRPTATPTSFTKIGEYFYPFNYNFMPAVRTGITNAQLVSPGRGLSAFANISDDRTPEMLFEKDGRIFSAVTNQTSSLDLLRKPLAAETKKTTSSKPSTSRSSSSTDTKKYWEEIKSGKKRLFVNMNTAAAIAYVLQIAKEHEKVKFVLVATGPNLYPLLDQIKSLKNVEIILQPGIDTVPYTRDLMNVSRLLAENEIPFALSISLSRSQMNSNQDDPMFPVANLVHTGLDRDLALKSLTMKPAELLGISKTHGSLAKDKKANFLIFDGDPLTTGSRLEQVFLNGNKIHEN
ncbi:MAG: amidohydrolase family protein [Planctomycetota bacterium]